MAIVLPGGRTDGANARRDQGKEPRADFDLFRTAVQNPRQGVLPVLLVDSEGPVGPGTNAWDYLRALEGWEKPDAAGDGQAFLMVQVMETWFVADRAMLRDYFGSAFRENQLRAWPHLEAISKPTVLNALAQATAACTKRYAKGRVSFDLLARLNPAVVEDACPHARLFLDQLRRI